MAVPAEQLFEDILPAILRAHEVAAGKIVSDVQDRISVPVGYKIGPKGGSTKIRSKRGESPRKDTGKLHADIQSASITDNDQVSTSVFTEVIYAEPLENDLDRPIFGMELEAVEDLILDSVIEAIEKE